MTPNYSSDYPNGQITLLINSTYAGKKEGINLNNNIRANGKSRCPLLREGSTGVRVRELQKLLLAAGFMPGKVDGIFGPQTKMAVVNFQNSSGLVRDGIVGRRTWTALGVNCG